MKRLTTEEFIERSIIKHNNKYNYNLVEYKNSQIKVTILCKIHGEFFQKPNDHLSGYGCPKCSNNIKSNIEEFIIKGNIIHFYKYDYSLVNYINNHTKVKIICKVHGIFKQTPKNHIIHKSNCPNCAIDNFSGHKHPRWKFDKSESLSKRDKCQKIRTPLNKIINRKINQNKETKSEGTCGFTQKELFEHLKLKCGEGIFNLWFYNRKKYHIHHIIPIVKFVENNIMDLKVIHNLDNLTILTREDNLKLGNKCDWDKLIQYLKSKGIEINA